jgi:hypothetical protein
MFRVTRLKLFSDMGCYVVGSLLPAGDTCKPWDTAH